MATTGAAVTPVVCLMARVPVLGAVKTRLARALGDHGALGAYERLLEHTIARVSAGPFPVELWMAGDEDLGRGYAQRHALAFRAQAEGDLGARMLHVIEASHARGMAAIVIGGDVPPLDAALLERAASTLERCDVVVAPAEDGGYGLIAMRRPEPALFSDMPWSTSAVMARTRERCAGLALELVELPQLWDVDELVDWRRFCTEFGV